MAYTGDSLGDLNTSEPDGSSEPVANVDDAIRQVKRYLVDTLGHPANSGTIYDEIQKLKNDIANINNAVANIKYEPQLVTLTGATHSLEQIEKGTESAGEFPLSISKTYNIADFTGTNISTGDIRWIIVYIMIKATRSLDVFGFYYTGNDGIKTRYVGDSRDHLFATRFLSSSVILPIDKGQTSFTLDLDVDVTHVHFDEVAEISFKLISVVQHTTA